MSRVKTIGSLTVLSLVLLGVLAALAQTAERPPTELYVRTTPAGAAVFVDGKEVGTSPSLVEVEPGDHSITVKLDGHQPKTKTVTLREGRIRRVVLRLQKEPAAAAAAAAAKRFLAALVARDVAKMQSLIVETPPRWTAEAMPGLVKEIRDEVYVNVPHLLTKIRKTLVQDDWAAVRIYDPLGPQGSYVWLVLRRGHDGWRVCYMDDSVPKITLESRLKEFISRNGFEQPPRPEQQPAEDGDPPEESALLAKPRRVTLLHADRVRDRGIPAVLDLASGELIAQPKTADDETIAKYWDELGRGDLAYPGEGLMVLRRGTVEQWNPTAKRYEPAKAVHQQPRGAAKPLATGYALGNLPLRLRITTGDGKTFDVTVLEKKTGGDWIEIEYRPSPELESQPEGGGKTTPWGEAVEGVQLRAYAEKAIWIAGDTPALRADMRNTGGNRFKKLVLYCDCWELELDGRWYGTTVAPWGIAKVLPFGPGTQQTGLVVPLWEHLVWQSKDGNKPLQFLPGRHTIRVAFCLSGMQESEMSDVHTRRGPETRKERVVSRAMQVEVRPASADQPAWGPAVEGVQCRIRAEKPTWPQGTAPKLFADLRNQGKRKLRMIGLEPEYWQMEIDGEWHQTDSYSPPDENYLPLGPGEQLQDREVRIPAEESIGEKLRELRPGKHVLRVAKYLHESREGPGESERRFRVVSNPIEIEIVAAKPAVDDEKTAWGPAVEGVQCRIRAEKPTWPQGTVPKLLADLRNRGQRNVRIALEHESWEIEIDGKWHEIDFGVSGDRNYLPLGPGGQQQNLEVWILVDGSLSRKLRALEPGKHTLRVARLFHDGTLEERFRVVSNPVKIEIVAAKPAVGDEKTAWGPPVEGVQIRLWAEKKTWRVDEDVILKLDARNQGKRDLMIDYGGRGCFDIWVGHRKYSPDQHTSYCIWPNPFGPGRHHKGLPIGLDRRYPGLKLAPGKHTIRVVLKAEQNTVVHLEGAKAGTEVNTGELGALAEEIEKRRSQLLVVVSSNPIEIEIVPAAPGAEAEKTPWGKAVEGVQCRLQADKNVWMSGEVPTFKADLRNRGKLSFRVVAAQEGCELVLDGKSHPWPGFQFLEMLPLHPASSYEHIHISLNKTWFGGMPPELAPGNHKISIRFQCLGVGDQREKLLALVESNTVEFEIHPAGEKQPDDQEKTPPMEPEVRRVVEAFLAAAIAGRNREAIRMTDPASAVGHQLEDIRTVEGAAAMKVTQVGVKDNTALAVTTPVKDERGRERVLLIRLIKSRGQWVVQDIDFSSPAEATGKLEAIQSPTGIEAPPTEAGTEVQKTAWGPAVEGVQIRLWAEKKTWRVDEEVILKVDCRNQGKRDLRVHPVAETFALEVDGKWHTPRDFPKDPLSPFGPGREYPGIQVQLQKYSARARDVRDLSQLYTLGPRPPVHGIVFGPGGPGIDPEPTAKDKPLELSPGKHTIRLALRALPKNIHDFVKMKHPPLSNPVEIEIVPAEPHTRKVHLPDFDPSGERVVLDLASGDLLLEPASGNPPEITQFSYVDVGDLFYDGVLGCKRGRTVMRWDGNRFVPLPAHQRRLDATVHRLPKLPCRLLITTFQKRHFDVSVLAVTADGGLQLEYRPADPSLVPKSAPEQARRVHLPDADTPGAEVVLDLASGETLKAAPNGKEALAEFTRLGKGDLFYNRALGCLRGATAMRWDGQRFVPLPGKRPNQIPLPGRRLDQLEDQYKLLVYQLPETPWIPCRLLITTAERKHFDLTVLSVTEKGGIVLEYRPAKPAAEEEKTAWGPGVEGVQCRIRAEKSTWPQGTVPKLLADLRNQGQRNLRIALEHESWEIEIDGKWHQTDSGMTGRRRYLPLPPGGQQQNLKVWISEGDNLGRRLRALPPGKHTLRVARLLNSSRAPGEEILRLVSNPIEIEIVPADAAAPQSAAAQPPATAATGETYLPGEKGRVYPSAEQRDAVTALEQLGALVMRDADGGAKTVDLKGTQATNAELVHLKGLASLKYVDLFGINISDAGLVHLKGLTELERLSLNGTAVTDDGLKHVKGLTKLKTLNLYDTKVTDAGLEHLKGLTALEALTLPSNITDAGLIHLRGLTDLGSLSLSFTQVTDAGLAQLKGLSQIEDLGLRSTKVSDAGLVHLKDLPQLERLRLNDTQVTVEGVKQLKQARPKLQIFHNEYPGPDQPGFHRVLGAAGVEEVQVRLKADKGVWKAGEIPTFQVDVRNGAKDKLHDTFGRRVIHHLEFDGRWYRNSDSVRKRQLDLPPGEELNRLGVSLRPEDWHREGTPNTPQLTPGKHIVRVAFVGTLGAGSERDGGKPVRAVSNPVEIEILPDTPDPEHTDVKPDQKDAAVAPQEPGPRSQPDAQGDTSSPVDEALDIIERHSLTGVDRGELTAAAIRGMIGKFDPDSAYLGVEQVARANRELGQDLAGVGLELRFAENARLLTVVAVLPGMPAHQAGVRPGDTITAIDGKRIEDLSQGKELETAVKLLRGKPGDEVVLHVRHVGPKTVHAIRIMRAIIDVPTVRGDTRGPDYRWNFMLDDEQKIGYVRLTRFGARSAEELQDALNELKSQGMKGLILDLRNNPGGSLSQAIRIADLFVERGIIVSVQGRDQPGQVWSAKKEGTFGGFPMAVLVNGNSAGAAEIVAACLQDHKRAIVVGERTYGRGITQGVFELEGGKNALRLTTATFLRPTGKNLHRAADAKPSDDWGVAPDAAYEVKLAAEESKQYDRYRQARDAFSGGGPPASDFKDRPLQKSLDYILALHR